MTVRSDRPLVRPTLTELAWLSLVGAVLWIPLAWWLAQAVTKHAHVGLDSIEVQDHAVASGTPLPAWADLATPLAIVSLTTMWLAILFGALGVRDYRRALLVPVAGIAVFVLLWTTDTFRIPLYALD